MADREFGFETLCLHAGQIPDAATGSPTPSSDASSTDERDDRPSAFLATNSTGRPWRRSHWAKCRSAGVTRHPGAIACPVVPPPPEPASA